MAPSLIPLFVQSTSLASSILRISSLTGHQLCSGRRHKDSLKHSPVPNFHSHTVLPRRKTPVCAVSNADATANSGGSSDANPNASELPEISHKRSGLAFALYKFTRPHTIRGTILGSISGCARAVLESPSAIDWGLIPRAVMGMLALLFGNAYIVGINQIYDVRLDRINKPFLPLASNEMSKRVAWFVIVTSAILGLFIVKRFFSSLIFGLYAFGMVFGTLYSIPPFRFKRYPLLAAITISCVRGFLMNFGVYHATKSALGVPFAWSPPITFLAIFMSVFATVIALSKDLPDIRGDIAEGVPTFASSIGPARMIHTVYIMLGLNYIAAILVAFFAPPTAFNRLPLGIGHAILGAWLMSYMPSVDPTSMQSIKKFYAFIWKLFYAEYLLFPFI